MLRTPVSDNGPVLLQLGGPLGKLSNASILQIRRYLCRHLFSAICVVLWVKDERLLWRGVGSGSDDMGSSSTSAVGLPQLEL